MVHQGLRQSRCPCFGQPAATNATVSSARNFFMLKVCHLTCREA